MDRTDSNPMPTNFVSPGASMVHALQQMMVERETQRRQAFLDSLAKQREERENRIQTESLASLKDQRESINQGRAETSALGVAKVLRPNQNITPDAAETLRKGNLGVLVKTGQAPDQQVAPPQTPGYLQGVGQNVREGGLTDTFTGTADQVLADEGRQKIQTLATQLKGVKDRQEASRLALAAGVAPAQVDDVLNAYMGKAAALPTSASEYEYAKANGYKGSYEQYQNEDANRHKPIVNVNSGAPLDTSPESLKADMNDVLMGRQTLYNIRQTMGRNNQSASYMQKMRAAIKKEDPDFDFVASDAGGKAVSSTYYQKGIASINGVMPNLDKIVQISHEVPRIGIVGVDALLQRGAMQFNGKNVTSLHQARKLLADEIGVALGQGSVSDMKLQLGFDISDPAVSDEVFAENIGLVKEFLENRKKGLNSLRYHSAGNAGPDGSDVKPSSTDETPEQRRARLRKAAGL
jgi:hypothetical protein